MSSEEGRGQRIPVGEVATPKELNNCLRKQSLSGATLDLVKFRIDEAVEKSSEHGLWYQTN